MYLQRGDLAVGVDFADVFFVSEGAVGGFGFLGGLVDDHARGGEGDFELAQGDVRGEGAGAVYSVEGEGG